MAIGVLQALVRERVEHEQALVQLRMLADTLDQRLALPANLADDAQPRPGPGGPGALECVQQIRMVLARFDGADHQEYRVF
ncbi:hypothetical protein D3C84_975020 [compost metagenome]